MNDWLGLMSMIRCDECSRLVDSDDDPECFLTRDRKDWIVCEVCRERLGRELEEDDGEDS